MHTHKLILEKDIQPGNMMLLNKDYLGLKANAEEADKSNVHPSFFLPFNRS